MFGWHEQAAIEDENQYSVLEEQTKAEQEAARKEQEALRQRTKEMQVQINAEREAAAARKLNKLVRRTASHLLPSFFADLLTNPGRTRMGRMHAPSHLTLSTI